MKGTTSRLLGAFLALATACASPPLPGCAQASPHVPVGDPAYRDLDVLAARGMAGTLILGQRPYSRVAFARVVAAADPGRSGDAGPLPARVAEALQRLATRFAPELERLCAGAAPCPAAPRYLALRALALDATAADSPARPIPWQLKSALDADVDPLLQRNQGRVLADGWTLGGEAWADGVVGSRLAFQLAPRAWVAGGGGEGAAAALLAGYARVLVGNLSVQIGRDALRFGRARELGTAFSSNPRALDAVRLSMEEPRRLPWIFRGLGPTGFSALVADMGRGQDTPGSKLIVFQGAVRPHPRLEVDGALLNHQGGGVDPEATFGDRILDAFFILPRRPFYFFPHAHVKSDKAAWLSVSATLPRPGIELFVEVQTTDDHDFFNVVSQALGPDAAWTGGARATALGAQGRWDVWVEAGRVGLLAYTHHEFTSGLTLDRRVLGSPLGPLGTGVVAGVDRTGERGTLSLSAALERYSGDRYRNPDDGVSQVFRVADNPDELRARATVEWAAHAGLPGLGTGVRLGWERVTRFALGPASRSNVMAQVRATYTW